MAQQTTLITPRQEEFNTLRQFIEIEIDVKNPESAGYAAQHIVAKLMREKQVGFALGLQLAAYVASNDLTGYNTMLDWYFSHNQARK